MNHKQVLSTILVVLGVLTASAAQLTDLIGPVGTKLVISMSSLMMSILAGIQGVLSGQAGLISDVQSMPGIDKITVNAQANSTLAAIAVDPTNRKVEATPGAAAAVASTARNA